MTEPTMQNVFVCIHSVLVRGYGYRLFVGTTRHVTRMLLDDPEELLLVAEMLQILDFSFQCFSISLLEFYWLFSLVRDHFCFRLARHGWAALP